MFPSSKLVFICSLFIAIPSVISSETKGLIELKNVRAGATVNRLQRNETTIEVLSTIFDRNSSYPEIYRNFTEFVRYPPKWRSHQFDCLESIDSITHPAVKTAYKFSSNNAVDRSFHQLEEDLLKRQKLNIDSKYKNSDYTCILYELCNLKEERIRRDVYVFNEDNLPSTDDGSTFKYFPKKKAVFRTKRGVETDYVASITKGTCLAQVYVYTKDSKKKQSFSTYADKKPIFESTLVSATNNTKLEEWVAEFLNKTQSSLLNFENLSVENQTDIFKRMESGAIRDFRLVNLPMLGEKLPKLSPIPIKWQYLLPGSTINLMQSEDDTALKILDMGRETITELFPYKSDEDLSMTIRTLQNEKNIKPSCPFERLGIRSSDHVNDHEDVEFFDCMVERQEYGIPKYLKKEYKRMEVKVCRTVETEAVKEPLTIINWNKNFENFGYNVIIDENIILRYPLENETHYVSAIHKGDCLYQSFVYNINDTIESTQPIFKSDLISASGDAEFKNTVSQLLLNTDTPTHGLHQVLQNETLRSEVKKHFEAKYVLSINLRSLHTVRPRPQIDLIEYYFNFGNSLQASLMMIFAVMITTKFFIN